MPQAAAADANASAFVGRGHELSQALTTLSGQPPSGLLLLLGPPRVGKTAFLTELSRRLTERGVGVAYVHTQRRDVRDGASMAQALAAAAADGWLRPAASQPSSDHENLTALAAALDRLQRGCGGGGGGGGGACGAPRRRSPLRLAVSCGGGGGFCPGGGAATAASVPPAMREALRLLGAALESVPVGAPRPVLVVDDAIVLKECSNGQSQSQTALLRWLLYVVSEARSAHVVLASGDPGFLDWVVTAVNPAYSVTEVLGELTAQESLEYLKRLVPPEHHATLAGSASAIYEVCGGSPGILQACAASYQGDWREAALRATRDIRRAVAAGLSALPADGFARWQFAKAVTAVLAGPAEQGALAASLGRNGMWVLRMMLSRGLFALRPYSAWQRDVPAAAWAGGGGVGDERMMVVASSGAALYGMRQLRMPPAEELIKEEEETEGRHREYRDGAQRAREFFGQ